MVRFASSLENDLSSVESALVLDWSNGPVEGQVNRVKTLKRQMYGRAWVCSERVFCTGRESEGRNRKSGGWLPQEGAWHSITKLPGEPILQAV